MRKISLRGLVASLATMSLLASVACSKNKAPTPNPSATPAGEPAKGSTAAGGAEKGATASGDVVLRSHELPAPTRALADFTPKSNGFKFENYGNESGVVNLTPVEARRMFGDQVCATIEGDKCILTPAAEQWIETSNKGMSGGHCEGFAALSLLIERGQIDPKLFGATSVADLELKGNEKLQREIAYWFVTQGVPPMAQAEDKSLTPVEVVEKVQASLHGAETYTLGIYAPGYKMGHATTPYAVVDKGGDIVWLMHYDNNYPGEEKHIEVNKKTNTWSYTTAADPSADEHAYEGDADTKTLTIAPTSVRTGKLICHFCGSIDEEGEAEKGAKGTAETYFREIEYDGDADLLITEEGGKRLGYVGNKLVNEIPGAFFAADKSGADVAVDDEPTYYVPTGKKLKVTIDGSHLKKDSESDLYLFGRGYTLDVEGIELSPGQKDEVEFAADFSKVTYTTKKAETPTLVIGVNTAKGDFEFEVKVTGETAGQTVELSIDPAKGIFGVKVKGAAAGAKPELAVTLTKIDKAGKQVFTHKGLALAADQVATFDYANWKGNGTTLHTSMLDGKGAVATEVDEADEE